MSAAQEDHGAVPYGYCHCGCGEKTSLARQNRGGNKAGEPVRYKHGHYRRTFGVPLCGYVPDPETGCWEWKLYINPVTGYGISGRDPAHRVVWLRERGFLPEGLQLDHLCRNRRCVNPDHLEPVTPAVNIRRGAGTKLTAEVVRAMRTDPRSRRELAEAYGVAYQTVVSALNGGSWVDV